MIKAVFFDIDGTLRDYGSGRIPHSAKEAIGRARNQGVLCFAATGRHILEIQQENLLEALPGCCGVKWHDGLAVDILPKDGAKEKGISHVLARYGISREECAAIGDGYNDISMICWAGTGIAMKNGKEEVRRRADYITGSVMEDGIRQAIDYLLGLD